MENKVQGPQKKEKMKRKDFLLRTAALVNLAGCFFVLSWSCGRAPKQEPKEISNGFSEDATVIEYAEVPVAGKFAWKQEWNSHITGAIGALGPNLVNPPHEPIAEAQLLCPNYAQATIAQKKAFWALFFAVFARYESGYNPELRFKEPAPLNRYSEGLLQLSYDDEKNHVGCPLSRAKGNILEPQTNLTCGVVILNNQLAKVGALFPPRSYYWSVFTNKKQQIVNDFVRDSAQLNFCR